MLEEKLKDCRHILAYAKALRDCPGYFERRCRELNEQIRELQRQLAETVDFNCRLDEIIEHNEKEVRKVELQVRHGKKIAALKKLLEKANDLSKLQKENE